MKLTAESTDQITDLVIDGVSVPARVWNATTENGTPCVLFVTRVMVDRGVGPERMAQFDRELREESHPKRADYAIPLRMVL